MKKLLAIAALGGLFAATTLQAQVNVYISGSTAFRANAYRAITNLYGATLTGQNPGGVGSDQSGATLVTLTGTMPGIFASQQVNVFLSWNGSAQGTHNVNFSGDTIPFLTNSFTGTSVDTNQLSHTIDMAFSDVFQGTTPFTSTALVDTNVAIIPFCWVRSPSASTNLDNLTAQQLSEVFSLGFIPESYLTGNANDDSANVFFTGRNKDSGTRLVTALDGEVTGTPIYFQAVTNAWNKMTVNFIANGVNYGPGFSSGGSEALTLTNTLATATNGVGVGSLGYSDARTVVKAGGQIIGWNGAFPINGWQANVTTAGTPAELPNFADFTPIFKGTYSFWSYEHLLMKPTASVNVQTFYQNLAPGVDADLANIEAAPSSTLPVTAIRLSEMKVARPSDGGPIHP
jgi:hypothetical protein